MYLHSCQFVHTILHSIFFFFQIHISIHQQSTHLCFGSAVEHFMAALKVLDILASSFPASFYFPLNMTDPSWILAWPSPSPLPFPPTHGVHAHPWGCVLVRLHPSPDPLFLTIILLALCSNTWFLSCYSMKKMMSPFTRWGHWGSEVFVKLSTAAQQYYHTEVCGACVLQYFASLKSLLLQGLAEPLEVDGRLKGLGALALEPDCLDLNSRTATY